MSTFLCFVTVSVGFTKVIFTLDEFLKTALGSLQQRCIYRSTSPLFCTSDIDDCDERPCQNGGNFTDEVNDFSCDCVAGYTGKFIIDFLQPSQIVLSSSCNFT